MKFPAVWIGLLASGIVGLAAEPVSFHREIAPLLKRNCVACHKPGKTKGGLDVTTHAAILKGGKSGGTVAAGHPAESELVTQLQGEEPEMPKDAEPLSAKEIELISRWVAEGAKDDTVSTEEHSPNVAPEYKTLPATKAVAWSPDGSLLAVAAFHEVILRSADGRNLVARLVGDSSQVESLAFSPDGKFLAVSGGAPSEFGEVQIWEVGSRALVRSIKTSNDCVFGLSWSPDGTKVAVGCADKLVRAFSVTDGVEVMKCDNHIDWVFGTAFSQDGTKLVSGSRDKAVKLIDLATGHLIDDINRPREPVVCLARHPKEDVVAYGTDAGMIRIHRIEPRGGRLAEGDDKENSFVRECDRLPGAVHALAFSPDGQWLAATGAKGETRIFKVADGKRVATIAGEGSSLFAAAFRPDSQLLATAGADGQIRFWTIPDGKAAVKFVPVPLDATASR